ncbi:MAG TPA: hypothetical protein VM284_06935 [Candidatus Limnocylindria bacterium]|nr:hypothetical protein [Candidatus Limnocylindria bacterium]
MAQTGTRSTTTRTKSSSSDTDNNEGDTAQTQIDAVVSGAQQAADVARQTAERAAAKLPDAVASARVTARDTQVALEGMDGQSLLAGTTFSLGLGIGLFVAGAHRLLVTAALLPAIAMVLTLLGRDRKEA